MSPLLSERLHLELKLILEKELFLVREMLGNLHQEELSLIFQDTHTYQQLAHIRLEMQDRLTNLQNQREMTTEKLRETLQKPKEPLDLRGLLSDTAINRWEILNIHDQLTTLTDRMARQQLRNQHLIEHPEHLLTLRHQTLPVKKSKRQAVITLWK